MNSFYRHQLRLGNLARIFINLSWYDGTISID